MSDDNGMAVTVRLHLTEEDLRGLADRYEGEFGVVPSYRSRKFRRYCQDMVRAAVGAAGASGWDAGAV